MKTSSIGWAGLLASVMLSGCATVPTPYKPSTVGSLNDSQAKDALEVVIEPQCTHAIIGEPIRFAIRLRNVGTQAFWIPRDPDLMFMWVYPNWRRDNFLAEFDGERDYADREVTLLRPGAELSKQFTIKTYYFNREGVTEFRALVHASRNTNPSFTPFWHGKALSNAFGVMVQSARSGRFAADLSKSVAMASGPAS